jgi:hypothetical protein
MYPLFREVAFQKIILLKYCEDCSAKAILLHHFFSNTNTKFLKHMKKEKRFGSIKKQVYKILQSSYAFILIFCLQSLYSKAQDPGTIALNKQLRHLFSGIHPPVPGKLFFV